MGSKRRLDGILVGHNPFNGCFAAKSPADPLSSKGPQTRDPVCLDRPSRDRDYQGRYCPETSSTVPDFCAYMSEQSTLLVFSSLWVSCWVMALLPPGGTTRQHIRGTQGDLRGHLTVTTGLFGVGQVYTLNKLHQISWNPVEYSEILKNWSSFFYRRSFYCGTVCQLL